MVQAHLASQKKYADRANERTSSRRPDAAAGDDEEQALDVYHPGIKLLLQLALTDSAARRWLINGADSSAWSTMSGGDFLQRILAAPVDPADPTSITAWLSTLKSSESSALTGLLHNKGNAIADGLLSAHQAVASLRIASVAAEIDQLQNQLRTANPDPATVLALTTRLIALKKELNVLQSKLREIPESD